MEADALPWGGYCRIESKALAQFGSEGLFRLGLAVNQVDLRAVSESAHPAQQIGPALCIKRTRLFIQ